MSGAKKGNKIVLHYNGGRAQRVMTTKDNEAIIAIHAVPVDNLVAADVSDSTATPQHPANKHLKVTVNAAPSGSGEVMVALLHRWCCTGTGRWC